MHKSLLIPALGFSILLLVSCGRTKVEASTGGVPAADVPTVATARVQAANLARNIVLTAEFKPYQEVDVMAKVAGYVKEIRVDIGDRVKKGQLLATLEVPELGDDLRRANAAVERAEADVTHANDELERAKSAHEIAHISYVRLNGVNEKRPGLVAQQEIDDAHSKDLVTEAQVSAAQSALDSAKEQVHVNSAESARVSTLILYTRVTAPFDGVVTRRFADTGSMIQAGISSQTQAMPLVRLSQNELLRLILPVPESAVPTVHVGQDVDVKVPTLHRSFHGRVVRFADKLALDTRTMDTEVDVPNPSLVLIPGMYAEVDLTLARHDAVLSVPVTAVDFDPSNTSGSVMVVTPNHRIEVRRIAVGMETADRVEVRSGLNEGDTVVVSGRPSLQAGEEVHSKLVELGS
jgi:RND family efflux transporter MFP subunit